MRPRPVYLDWNATTPPHAEVREAMRAALDEAWANPASVHRPGRRARDRVERAREAVAALVGFDPRDVVLTSGGTEANNLALRGLAGAAPGPLGIVTSRLEHPSVARVVERLAEGGAIVEWVAPTAAGTVEPDAAEEALARATARGAVRLVVALQAVNHETGVVQPVGEVAAIAKAAGALLLVDAVQAVGRVEAAAWAGADLVSVAAHKIRGPKGVGALVTRAGLKVRPLLFGGAQERGMRPGTQDPAACAGFAVAARRAAGSGPARYAEVAALRDRMQAELVALARELGRGEPTVNGSGPRAPHVLNLSWPGWRGDELCAALDLEGLAVSSGSACSAGTAEPSAVIRAMVGAARASSAVRISLGDGTTGDDVDAAVRAFRRVLSRG